MLLLANASADGSPGGETALLLLLVIYFLPAIIAHYRDHHRSNAVLLVTFFLGWTGFGWLFALAWAIVGMTKKDATLARDAFRAMIGGDKWRG